MTCLAFVFGIVFALCGCLLVFWTIAGWSLVNVVAGWFVMRWSTGKLHPDDPAPV